MADDIANGSWVQCSDGSLLEPLDAIHLLFPNRGRNSQGENVCFVPKPFSFPPLENILPPNSDFFTADALVDSIVVLALLCFLTAGGMVILKLAWEQLDSRFATISPAHKKWYVVANLSKAFYLAAMSLSPKYATGIYNCMFLDKYGDLEVKRSGHVYIVTDVVALLLVPKLPSSTVMHHVATTALMLMVSSINLKLKGWTGLLGVSKMCLFYGMCSTYSFLVNAYLALRVVYPVSWKPMVILCKAALWGYIACCILNWTVHLWWVGGLILGAELSIPVLLYSVPMATMVHDDIKLINWLVRQDSPMSADQDKKDR